MSLAFTTLVRAELKLYFSNRRALLMSIVAPILIAAFFGSLFGGSSKLSAIPVGVVDLDHSSLSVKVVAALKAESTLQLSELPEAEAIALVQAGKLKVSVVLPAGLGAASGKALFGAGPKPEITLHYDPSQATVLSIVRGLLAQTMMQEVSQSAFSANSPLQKDLREDVVGSQTLGLERKNDLLHMLDAIDTVNRGKTDAEPAASAAPASSSAAPAPGGLSMPYATRELEAVQPNANAAPASYNSYSHSFGGMGVQFILMAGVDLGVGLLVMRRLGLWKRLRAAPLSRFTLLSSRVAATSLITLCLFSAIYGVAFAVFGVRVLGSWAGFVLVLATFSLLTACFGLLIAAIGKTPEATRGLAILVTLLMVMLGGAWVPSFIFPEWLQTFSYVVPTRWAVDALDAMTWRAQPFTAAIAPVLVMLGFSAVFALIAAWRFNWEE